MANDNKTSSQSNPFEGATFNTKAINALSTKANQALPNLNGLAGVVPYNKNETWTPLGDLDAANAGIEKAAGGISSVKYFGAIEKLSGGLGLTNDAIAVGQHLLAGRFDAASVEFVGVVGQGTGAAGGYLVGKTAADFVTTSNGLGLGLKFVASGLGAFFGSTTSKSAAEAAFNELDRTPALAAGEAVHQVATFNGQRYGLGLSVRGTLEWYGIDASPADTRTIFAQSTGVVSTLSASDRAALTDQFFKSTASPTAYADYQRKLVEITTQGDIAENILPRIQAVGTVVIDPNSGWRASQYVAAGRSPDGKDPLGQHISDGAGKSHYWRKLSDGNLERIDQENFGEQGSRVTVTQVSKDTGAVFQQRQTVAGKDGIVSDAILKPNASGQLTLSEIQLGGPLDAASLGKGSSAGGTFSPLSSTGDAATGYTIQKGDSLWKIGQSLGLSDAETMQFIRDVAAAYKAQGLSGNINDLKVGNTLALPEWVQNKRQNSAATAKPETAVADSVFIALVEDVADLVETATKAEVNLLTQIIQAGDNHIMVVTSDAFGNASGLHKTSDGTVIGSFSTEIQPNGVALTQTFDAQGNPLMKTYEQTLADSSRLSETRNTLGQLVSSSIKQVQELSNGQTTHVTETINHLAKGSEIASSKELVTSGGARIINSTTADGHIQEDTYATVNGKQTLQSSKIISYSQAERDTAALDVSLAGLELIQALRSNNKVQAAGSLIRLVNNAEIASNQMPTLGAIGTGFSGAVSLISALDSWGDASDGQRIALTARAVLGANEVAKAFSANGQTGFLDAGKGFTALNVAGGIVALASLESTLESGNPFAIASSAMSIANAGAALMGNAAVFGPQVMIAVAIASIVFGSLFGGSIEYPEPPPAGTVEIGALADGTLGMLLKDADGKVYQTRNLSGKLIWQETQTASEDRGYWASRDVGDSLESYWVSDIQSWAEPVNLVKNNQNFGLGADVLSQRMSALIGDLQAQAAKDGTHLVLDRLPMLTVVAYPSFDRNGVDNFFFAIRFNDPGTGAQQMMAAANQDMAKQFKEMAGYAGAVVGATEWAQIQAKRAAGDAFATETEGQYVDRLSGPKEGDSVLTKAQADAQEASNRQTYSLLTLDLEGNGITRKAQQASGMSLEDVQGDTTKGVTRLNLGNCSLRQTIPCIRYQWMRLRKSSPTAMVGSFYQHSRTYPTIPRQPEQQAALSGYRAELPQSEADIRAFDAAVRQLITPTVQLLMDDIQGMKSINVNTGSKSFTDGQVIGV
ncbi:LysM peptidoglycan-binding domain-containing protein [Limnohabitans sp. DM1]|uniref:LysM peptidoglycan-binding domain-containing protein n=1 Tax=Limnohabitans sp. DM1 TaxID=1597955 RepID=UPI000AC9D621|nr:LysM peptidoglycan-binding domain-containing protein [Limnohabitans sp. DM1]